MVGVGVGELGWWGGGGDGWVGGGGVCVCVCARVCFIYVNTY